MGPAVERVSCSARALALLVAFVVSIAGAALAAPPPDVDPPLLPHRPPALHWLTIIVQDGHTGERTSARVSVTDCEDEPAYPLPSPSGLYHEPHNQFPGYFYTKGQSSMFVPEGPAEVIVSRGFEFATIVDTVKVLRDTTVTYDLSRWIDMNALGLYSGDCHTHTHHGGGVYTVQPADALWVAQAEGLNVINCLDQEYYFTGGPDTCSTQDCIVYMAEEHRSNVYGHSGLLGISSLIEPFSTTWWPLLMDISDTVHLQEGAAMISAHPISTDDFFDLETFGGTMLARELPMDMIKRKVDAYELLSGAYNSHERTIEMWHRLLNCGFRLPPCTGTDACMNAGSGAPPGVYRTYVQIPGEFTYYSWLSNLVAGRTFATNGPLFTKFEVRNFAMGDSVCLYSTGAAYLNGSVRVECETPLRRVDILCNGERRRTFFAREGQCVIDTTFVFPILKSSWVSARASGPRVFATTVGESLHAHSGPVYFSLNDERILETDCAQELVDWVSDFERLVMMQSGCIDPGQFTRILAETAAARQYYSALASGAATGSQAVGEGMLGDAPWLAPARPNPLRSRSRLSFFIPTSGRVHLNVYAPSGRLVRTLVNEDLTSGSHAVTWDGVSDSGTRCGAGVYLCSLETMAGSFRRKIVLVR
jgi:hypothetical protein